MGRDHLFDLKSHFSLLERGIQTNSEYALSEQFYIECNKLDKCLLTHATIDTNAASNMYSDSNMLMRLINFGANGCI